MMSASVCKLRKADGTVICDPVKRRGDKKPLEMQELLQLRKGQMRLTISPKQVKDLLKKANASRTATDAKQQRLLKVALEYSEM